MTRLRSLCLILGMLTVTGCAALASAFGLAATAAPAVVSVLDAYAATAKAIAPAASQPDLAVLADLLRKRDECVVAASVATTPDAGPTDGDEIAAALLASADASRELAAVVAALAPKKPKKHKAVDAGSDASGEGGT